MNNFILRLKSRMRPTSRENSFRAYFAIRLLVSSAVFDCEYKMRIRVSFVALATLIHDQ
jgi:hypothetical protein